MGLSGFFNATIFWNRFLGAPTLIMTGLEIILTLAAITRYIKNVRFYP